MVVVCVMIKKRLLWPNKIGKQGSTDVIIWTSLSLWLLMYSVDFQEVDVVYSGLQTFFMDCIMCLVLHMVYRKLYLMDSGLL